MVDPVARLLRLRAAEADAARRDLADALRARDQAAARTAAAQAALSHEARIAPTDATHPLAGAYAAWLPGGQAAIARAGAEEHAAAAALAAARAALAEARLAERACETLAEQQADERRAAALKREQVRLDDVRPKT